MSDALKILTLIDLFSLLCFVLHIVLACIRQWILEYTIKDLLLPNTVSQKVEKLHTCTTGLDDTGIPHIKMKITEMLLGKSSIP